MMIKSQEIRENQINNGDVTSLEEILLAQILMESIQLWMNLFFYPVVLFLKELWIIDQLQEIS